MAFSREAIWSSRQRCFDLALDLVESAVARRRDAGDVVPDVTAVGFERIVVDADVGGEGGADDSPACGRLVDELAARIAAGAVDGIDR